YETFVDMLIPGRGIPLTLTHTYSSAFAGVDGPLGFGWTDSYNVYLSFDSVSGNVTVHQENGAQVTFAPAAGGGFTAAPRVIATLSQNPDGSYVFTRQARSILTFTPSG